MAINTFNIGVSGLIAQSNKINSISENIANVNTIGYKGFASGFSALIQTVPNPIFDTHSGVQAGSSRNNSLQGEVSSSSSGTDISINGGGFFAVTEDTISGSPLRYTRAGSFSPDKDGNMRNSAGFYLQGWALDGNGALPQALQSASYDSGTATSNIAIKANLNASTGLYNPAGNIAFTNNPTAGDTITINGVAWTFVASGATGNQTNIGTDLDTTLTQLKTDLNSSTNSLITPATYSNSGGTKLGVIYDATNAGAENFTLSSSSVNGVVSPLLLYNASVSASNMTSGAISSHFNKPVDIIDNNGAVHKVDIKFLKTNIDAVNNTSTWAVEINSLPATDITTTGGQIAAGTVVFNGDGSLKTITSSLSDAIVFPWTATGTTPTGATTATANNTITFNWGTAGSIFGSSGATTIGRTDGLRQLATTSQVDELTQNGHSAGTLKNVDIADNGIVTAHYSNGTSQALFVIPLAKFNNPDGLNDLSGTAYADSLSSGFINFFAADKGGVGSIRSGSLENSNVDLSKQYADIIVAQRAYQGNSKIITTSDDMLKTLSDMLR